MAGIPHSRRWVQTQVRDRVFDDVQDIRTGPLTNGAQNTLTEGHHTVSDSARYLQVLLNIRSTAVKHFRMNDLTCSVLATRILWARSQFQQIIFRQHIKHKQTGTLWRIILGFPSGKTACFCCGVSCGAAARRLCFFCCTFLACRARAGRPCSKQKHRGALIVLLRGCYAAEMPRRKKTHGRVCCFCSAAVKLQNLEGSATEDLLWTQPRSFEASPQQGLRVGPKTIVPTLLASSCFCFSFLEAWTPVMLMMLASWVSCRALKRGSWCVPHPPPPLRTSSKFRLLFLDFVAPASSLGLVRGTVATRYRSPLAVPAARSV